MKVNVSGIVDNGFNTPKRGYTTFMNSPTKIENATLRPIASKKLFTALLRFRFRIRSRRNPGMKEMQRKPNIALTMAMSKKIVNTSAIWDPKITLI